MAWRECPRLDSGDRSRYADRCHVDRVRVPGDVGLPVPVTISISGRTRLLLELTITAIAAYGLWTTVSRAAGETLLTLVGVHYAVTWEASAGSSLGRRAQTLSLTTPSRFPVICRTL